MTRHSIYGMYFSGTGTTKKVVTRIAEELAAKLGDFTSPTAQLDGPAQSIDFTPPAARKQAYRFADGDIVVFGVPVIAGRVPNVLLPFLNTLEGGGALAIPVVVYGNRNFDDALIELRNILEERGYHTVAAAAFVGEHSFSRRLAAGRPDGKDMAVAEEFAERIAEKIRGLSRDAGAKRTPAAKGSEALPSATEPEAFPDAINPEALSKAADLAGPVPVDGCDPLRPYYQPRDRKGNPINILKVKPKLDAAKCTGCGICADACPMGSIRPENPGVVEGICIKCCGCEKKCPEGALYFDDPGYLYHREELELGYPERKEPKLFL